ncbi:uncharacterized protein B0P05DRAFT_583618 [Gilbertella persicaria]|uniref:uncharacterized protein n=1 Tax=Gilbertella persicaria TaxID=101096 RepID=UPI00222123FF|nr:uncharacterized protein B0P05DRAFT_583618 [Gilbertella persicaria]KAI8092363.1 hypothetical protein B0P05DRAFT_583618 [Gilbertella persicaria]
MSAKSSESTWSVFIDLFLSGNLNDTDVNDYSLEYLGIITLGDKVGNKQTRASYPKDLVATTNKHLSMAKQDVFLKFDSKYNTFFSALEVSVDNCHTVLLRNSLAVKNTNDPSLSFCYEYFMIFVLHVFTKCGLKRISKSESAYNFRVIFRFMDVVVDALPQCEFMPGEVRLQAIKDELERQDLSTASYYNADGIIYDLISGVELMLLETSGPFGNNDIKRETKDYVKAAYGLLAMLHKIAHKYVYADIDIFKQLKVCFVHAANNKIRLWAFCLVSKQLYILNRIDSSVLPTDSSNAENDLKGMTNLFWKLKQTIEEATETLKKIKESHEKNKIFAEENPDSQIEQLISYLVEVAEVKLSSQISYAEDIYINSSPIIPDSLDFD